MIEILTHGLSADPEPPGDLPFRASRILEPMDFKNRSPVDHGNALL